MSAISFAVVGVKLIPGNSLKKNLYKIVYRASIA
jgi:hypothetical protein